MSGPSELQGGYAIAVFPRSLLDEGDVGIADTAHLVDLAPGTTKSDLQRALDATGTGPFQVQDAEVVPDEVRTASQARAVGVAIVAAITAIAAVVVGGDRRESFRITGIVVVPMVGGTDGVGEDAIVTWDGLLRIDPDARQSVARPHDIELGPGDMPSSIAIGWQATLILAAAVAVLAVPFGLLVGSAVTRAVIGRIGAIERVTVPWAGIALGCVALVVLANLVALVPERRARTDIVAAQLRGE